MASDSNVVQLRVGEQHSVRLAGLGAAGYRWAPEIGGDETVAEVEPAGTEEPESDAVGTSRAELFTIRALRPGVAQLRFAQRRPWEPPDQPPANEHVVELHVADHPALPPTP
jgi:predicted secreted protein